MCTLLVVTLLILFFSPRLHSSCLSILCCVSSVCVHSFFSAKPFLNLLYFFVSVKLCLFCFLFLFRTFFLLLFSFNRVLSNKRKWQLFFGRKTTCLTPPRIYLLNFCCLISQKKNLSSFFGPVTFWNLFFRKYFFWTSWKIPFPFFKIEKQYCPRKLLVQQKTILSRSHFLIISSCSEKYLSLQLFHKKFVFIISFLCFFHLNIIFLKKAPSKNGVLEKKKNFFYLLLIFHLFEETVFLFFNCPRNSFALVLFFNFSAFSVMFFWCFHLFWSFSSQKKTHVKNLFRENIGFWTFFWIFFTERNTLNKKKEGGFVQKLSFDFFSKKHFEKKLFQDPHALRIACAIEGSLDHCCVSWRSWASQVDVHSFVIDLGCGTSVASSRLSPFFLFFCSKRKALCFVFEKKKNFNFFL